MNISKTSSSWFFADAPFPLRFLLLYVRGDLIVLVPFIILLLIIGLFSVQWTMLLFGIYLVYRFLGEMIYWLLQQSGDRKYRPFDFGFKKLDNNAVYVLYQLTSLVFLVLSTGLVLYLLPLISK